jgi:hypothetical protein
LRQAELLQIPGNREPVNFREQAHGDAKPSAHNFRPFLFLGIKKEIRGSPMPIRYKIPGEPVDDKILAMGQIVIF